VEVWKCRSGCWRLEELTVRRPPKKLFIDDNAADAVERSSVFSYVSEEEEASAVGVDSATQSFPTATTAAPSSRRD
jgi:hypothetical protein